mmetsp:Transcript_47106/g.134808  ORF Transcript_47106/g.134808 Transcript_47106/m.134808 type:complete len:467 (-) Transcript_47106:771-2171(-)
MHAVDDDLAVEAGGHADQGASPSDPDRRRAACPQRAREHGQLRLRPVLGAGRLPRRGGLEGGALHRRLVGIGGLGLLQAAAHGSQPVEALRVEPPAVAARAPLEVHAADEVAGVGHDAAGPHGAPACPLVRVAQPGLQLGAVVGAVQELRRPAPPRRDAVHDGDLHRGPALRDLAPEQQDAQAARRARRQQVGALGHRGKNLLQDGPALPVRALVGHRHPAQPLRRALQLVREQHLSRGGQPRHEVEPLWALARGVQHRQLRPRAPLLPRAAPEVRRGAVRRKRQGAVQPPGRREVAEEGPEGAEQGGHWARAAHDRLLEGLRERAHVHRHQQPRQRWQAALPGPRDLPLPQPPLDAAQGVSLQALRGALQRWCWHVLQRNRVRHQLCPVGLEPPDVPQSDRLVYCQVQGLGTVGRQHGQHGHARAGHQLQAKLPPLTLLQPLRDEPQSVPGLRRPCGVLCERHGV